MSERQFYLKCEVDVYIEYIKHLYEFGKLKEITLNYEKVNIIRLLCYKYINDDSNDLSISGYDILKYTLNAMNLAVISKKLDINIIYNNNFSEVVSINYINEFIRNKYNKLVKIMEYFSDNDTLSNFMKTSINDLTKFIYSFSFYKDDDKLDFYAEKLRMHYDKNESNIKNILKKLSECINISLILYKYNLISEDIYLGIVNNYNSIISADSIKISSKKIEDIFALFGKVLNHLYSNIEEKNTYKKKIKN